jgi:hypothetical protein
MLDPATARLCVWRLPLEAAFRLFSKLGSLGGSIRERFSRTGRTRPALARPAFSRWLLENDRLRERWPCQWLNVLYFPFSETSPKSTNFLVLFFGLESRFVWPFTAKPYGLCAAKV